MLKYDYHLEGICLSRAADYVNVFGQKDFLALSEITLIWHNFQEISVNKILILNYLNQLDYSCTMAYKN